MSVIVPKVSIAVVSHSHLCIHSYGTANSRKKFSVCHILTNLSIVQFLERTRYLILKTTRKRKAKKVVW